MLGVMQYTIVRAFRVGGLLALSKDTRWDETKLRQEQGFAAKTKHNRATFKVAPRKCVTGMESWCQSLDCK